MKLRDKLTLMRKSASENERRIKEWGARRMLKCEDCKSFQREDLSHGCRGTKVCKDFQKK